MTDLNPIIADRFTEHLGSLWQDNGAYGYHSRDCISL